MHRRMLQAALVSGAFGVVAIAGLAVAQPATPEQTLAEQQARAGHDPGLEVEGLVTPAPTAADGEGPDTPEDTGAADGAEQVVDADDSPDDGVEDDPDRDDDRDDDSDQDDQDESDQDDRLDSDDS